MSSLYRCIQNYQSPYPKSILFRAGEVVVVGEEYTLNPAWKEWFRCLAKDGREAWIPKHYLSIQGESGTLLEEYDVLELSLTVDEVISVSDIINGFGRAQNKNGEQGWVPMNHLEILSRDE